MYGKSANYMRQQVICKKGNPISIIQSLQYMVINKKNQHLPVRFIVFQTVKALRKIQRNASFLFIILTEVVNPENTD